MPRRHGDTDYSAFFFLGTFEPAELANFNVQNVPLPGEQAFFEALGARVGLWWPSVLARDFSELLRTVADWLQTIASIHYIAGHQALDVRLHGWVEALDVAPKEAVLGFTDERFRQVPAPKRAAGPRAPTRRSIAYAGKVREAGAADATKSHTKRAAREAWRARLDGTDEAFLSAFRALECLRRRHNPGESTDDRKDGWRRLAQELSADKGLHDVLDAAAKAVRHGDRPETQNEPHPISTAREQREALIDYATDLVRQALVHDVRPFGH